MTAEREAPAPDPLAPLAAAALAGDRRALDALCRALQGPLFRLALRVLGASDASDATQEALVLVVTHLSQFRGEGRVLTWAYTIATRHLLRARAKSAARRARETSLDQVANAIRGGLAITEPSAVPDGDARVLAAETRLSCTQAMLATLSLEERVAIVLAEMLGADDELGARLCDVPGPTYRKRLSRARAKLVPILEELCGLAREDAPCTCARAARAKQIAGVQAPAGKRLPIVVNADVERTHEALGTLRRAGAVFALEPMLDAPEEVFRELRRRLPAVFGEEAS